ncbi:hypothetical protein [Candidatus Avelusimicrobium faecicola]|uniref:hypothetical protein n=1 Tax=Candidatus Avelusimicrobium faecicola TaxID=3416205 RepID=UPI00204D8873|nr:MAG TPA: Exodeoxyribonuclease 8 [Caudoviricetes sp.]
MQTMTDKEYFAYPAISKSQLHAFTRDNPMAFWRGCLLNPKHEPTEENNAIANGKLRHTLLLEPHKAESEFLVIEGGRGYSSRSTGAFQKVIADNPGVTVVTQEELALAKTQIDTLKTYKEVQDILKGASVEQAFFWEDEATGLPLKAKLDAIKRLKEGLLTIEYKTTGKEFSQIERGLDVPGWHWDAGMQAKAVKAKYGEYPFQMVFIVQSQTEGEEHRIRLFYVDQADLLTCVQYVDNSLAEIKERYEQWGLGNPAAWKTRLSFGTFQGYQGTAFSFGFDAQVAAMQG